jgi:hypothetical protein
METSFNNQPEASARGRAPISITNQTTSYVDLAQWLAPIDSEIRRLRIGLRVAHRGFEGDWRSSFVREARAALRSCRCYRAIRCRIIGVGRS